MNAHSTNQRTVSIVTVLTSLALFLSCTDVEEPTVEEGFYAFETVNVMPMDQEQILENHTVIVRDGVISEIGPVAEVDIPDGAARIDGQGRYLMPGLVEMHGHIPGSGNPEYAVNVLFLYISNGVTTVRNMAGAPYHLELRERVANGELKGPTIYAASPWMSPQQAPDPDTVEELVREHHEAGYDLMKVGSIDLATYERMAETAHEMGIPFGGHIPEEVGLVRALELGQKSIDHLDRYVEFLAEEHPEFPERSTGFFGSGVIDLIDRGRIEDAVELTIEAGTWNTPTLSLVEHLADPEAPEEMIQWPEMRYMPQEVLNNWVEAKHNFQARDDFQPDAAQAMVELRHELLRALYDNGTPVMLGSDAPQFFNVPGFSIHHEMRMMVDAGLSPYDVILTGTRNAAQYFEAEDRTGTVREGMIADLILLEADPLQDIANVQERVGVMVRGVWMTEEVIQEQLEQIAAQTQEY